MKIRTSSAKESREAGEKLARKVLARAPRKSATVLGLTGDLGSGKTTFTQGFARGLGVKGRIASPTFILIRHKKINSRRFKDFFHVDAYRLKEPEELMRLGLREAFADPKSIVLIEWADAARAILPKNTVWIKFSHGTREGERTIDIKK